MSKLQNHQNLTPFIDYIPAQVKENKYWIIEYYAIDPFLIQIKTNFKH
ncbi:hypothetical protein ACSIGC_16885 [Tenacibaculum sp. ZS6-P6]